MPGPWTDAHCHLADPRLASVLDAVVMRSREAGVTSWIQGGVDPDDWHRQRQLRDRFGAGVRLSFGLHPWWVAAASDAEVDQALVALEAALPDASAMGEIGLDNTPRRTTPNGALDRQHRVLAAQLGLASRVPKPLVLHVVRAHDMVLRELEARAPFPRGGLVHAFAGTASDARRYTRLGFHLSLGGGLLGRPKRAAALAQISPDHLVIETDAPDQAPRDWQVELNEPAFLPRIAEALAPLWGLSGADLLDRARVSLDTLFPS